MGLVVAAVMTAEVLLLLPSIARFRMVYLEQLIESGTLAALALDATPDNMVTEKWSKSGSSGAYGVIFADRFMIEAEGQAASIDELKAAVATVDQDDLEDLAG